MTALDPDALFACLDRHGVRYVLIGGLAAVLHGSPLPTTAGDLDLAFVPAGGADYTVLASRAKPFQVRGLTIRVAALEDVIRSKEAANRPKDRRNLPVLRQLLDELRRRGEA